MDRLTYFQSKLWNERRIFVSLKSLLKLATRMLPDTIYIKLDFYRRLGRFPNLKNPTTFNEKLQWLKLHDRKMEYATFVDKYEAKKYFADTIGGLRIIPTLGVWEDFDQIDFRSLPDQFVLKCTHDSGGLIICREKKHLDISKAREKLSRSLANNYFFSSREWPYKSVEPRIIAEEYMEDGQEGKGLIDYKFFCFNGEPRMLYVSQGLEDHKTARISFFDLDGNQMPFCRKDFQPFQEQLQMPANMGRMIDIARQLALKVNTPFVRIDLYSIRGEVYFSEITFSPCSGMIPFDPPEWDEKLGSWINLPEE